MSETILLALLLIPCLVVAIVFHEVAHGYVALLLGDPTAKERRRLSLNPLRHVDPVGTLVVPGLLALTGGPIFGWAKPVPVIKQRLDNPRYGMMAVAAAGPGTNFVLALVGAVLLGLSLSQGMSLGYSDGGTPIIVNADGSVVLAATFGFFMVLVNVFLAVFNLLPIPPFDGSHIVEGLLPPSAARVYERLRPFGMLLFVGLIAITWLAPGLNLLGNTIGVPVQWAIGHYLALADLIAR
ncbi:site-2 protease family protein [Aurantiacibacter xanthus]|uniref:Site-2 protease family protein n=1 Tax=Aurantiacibacter xanthus TaxID=1784712 RepID=A0A3A1PD46_9SPHN|nr:site-2 protease family protein [Aurantiacibacter xanthus]RIV90651.1 site-2 protease family protein [Aurantiacibacter xanthus]